MISVRNPNANAYCLQSGPFRRNITSIRCISSLRLVPSLKVSGERRNVGSPLFEGVVGPMKREPLVSSYQFEMKTSPAFWKLVIVIADKCLKIL